MGGIFHFHSAYVPALVASFLAIFIERKKQEKCFSSLYDKFSNRISYPNGSSKEFNKTFLLTL
ncbi:hypothetical protein CEXT_424061, partial [Caerostris extrusa]